jgi:hypothetical protein
MKNVVRLCALFLAIFVNPIIVAGDGGLSVAQLRNFAAALPELPGNIQGLQFFRGDNGRPSVAVVTEGQQSGWQLLIFNSDAGQKFSVSWKSGKLDESFSVSDASALKIFTFMDGRQTVEFSGCAPHSCPADVFSVLLYVPQLRSAFVATYTLGQVSYSRNSESPAARQYIETLNGLLQNYRKRNTTPS